MLFILTLPYEVVKAKSAFCIEFYQKKDAAWGDKKNFGRRKE
jgi:hypothetical protein